MTLNEYKEMTDLKSTIEKTIDYINKEIKKITKRLCRESFGKIIYFR